MTATDCKTDRTNKPLLLKAGVAELLANIGDFLAHLVPDGTLRFNAIEDGCSDLNSLLSRGADVPASPELKRLVTTSLLAIQSSVDDLIDEANEFEQVDEESLRIAKRITDGVKPTLFASEPFVATSEKIMEPIMTDSVQEALGLLGHTVTHKLSLFSGVVTSVNFGAFGMIEVKVLVQGPSGLPHETDSWTFPILEVVRTDGLICNGVYDYGQF